MTDIAEQVPNELTAGDSWVWTRDLSDYPAGTWTLSYVFKNAESSFSATASASGTTHSISIAAATTAGYKAGRYKWFARVTYGSTTTTIEDGWLDVLPDPSVAGQYDYRSWARRALDAIEATLEGRASSDQLAMSIAGRSISRIPLGELTQWRDRLLQEVRTEERVSQSGRGRNIKAKVMRV